MRRDHPIQKALSRVEADLLKVLATAAHDADLELLDKARWVIGQIQQISNGLRQNGKKTPLHPPAARVE